MSTLCNFAVWCVFKAQRPRDKLLQRFHVPWDSSNLEVIKAGANAATTNSEGSFFRWISRVKQRFQIHLRDSWNSWANMPPVQPWSMWLAAGTQHQSHPHPISSPSQSDLLSYDVSSMFTMFTTCVRELQYACGKKSYPKTEGPLTRQLNQSRHLVKSTSQGQHGQTGVFQAKK